MKLWFHDQISPQYANNDTIDKAARIVIEHGFTRVPVFGKNIDDIRGIIYSKT